MKTFLGWLLGGTAALILGSVALSALRAYAFSNAPPLGTPAPPAIDCHVPGPTYADCTVILSADPIAYHVGAADLQAEFTRQWCTGLQRRTDGLRATARFHVLLPDRSDYAEFLVRPGDCP